MVVDRLRPAPGVRVLPVGSFYGETLRGARVGELVLTEVRTPGGFSTPPHVHQRAYFELVLEGRWTEACGATQRVLEQLLALKDGAVLSRRRSPVIAVRDQGEQWARSLARTALAPLRPSQKYSRQKFPGLAREELETLVANFRTLTGRFENVRVLPGAKHSFIVTT